MDKPSANVGRMFATDSRHASEFAVEAFGLTKSFGLNRAIDGVDLAIPRGVVYGVLGPNGAGKTTTIRILATLPRPDAGTARVLGHDVVDDAAAVRAKISLTAQFASVDEELTAFENLVLLARLLGMSRRQARARAHDLLAAFKLDDAGGRLVAQLSGGMRRRLDIAASIIVTPDLLFLDEPTTGLDPRSRNQVWEIVRTIVDRGTTRAAHHAVPRRSRPAGRPDRRDRPRPGDRRRHPRRAESISWFRRRAPAAAAHQPNENGPEALLAAQLGVAVHAERDPAALTANIPAGGDSAREMTQRVGLALSELAQTGIGISDFAVGQPSLDEVFLALTGRPAAPAPDRSTNDEKAVA